MSRPSFHIKRFKCNTQKPCEMSHTGFYYYYLFYTGSISDCSRKQYIYCACVQGCGCVCLVTFLHNCVCLIICVAMIFVNNKSMKACSSGSRCVSRHSLLLTWLMPCVMITLFRNPVNVHKPRSPVNFKLVTPH